jgi:hypothetical protein
MNYSINPLLAVRFGFVKKKLSGKKMLELVHRAETVDRFGKDNSVKVLEFEFSDFFCF